LEYLKPRYKLHIITNGFQEVQDKKLRNSKIDTFFEHIINSEMAGVKKPNPIIFQLALGNAKVNAEKALMIGDNLEADILGAQAVGYRTLHFNAHNEPQHDFCPMISDLIEIKTFL
jgi:putative hydrolase of the HAD superfamily